jgi:hypothetical protein
VAPTAQPRSDRATRPAVDRAPYDPPTATSPLQLEVVRTGQHDEHGRAILSVTFGRGVIACSGALPLREAAAALALSRWADASLVLVRDGVTGEAVFEGTLGDLGGFGTAHEALIAEREAVRRSTVPDPRVQMRRAGGMNSGEGSGGVRTLDRSIEWQRLMEQDACAI